MGNKATQIRFFTLWGSGRWQDSRNKALLPNNDYVLYFYTLPFMCGLRLCFKLHWEIVVANTYYIFLRPDTVLGALHILSFNKMEAIRQKHPLLHNAKSTKCLPFFLVRSFFSNVTVDNLFTHAMFMDPDLCSCFGSNLPLFSKELCSWNYFIFMIESLMISLLFSYNYDISIYKNNFSQITYFQRLMKLCCHFFNYLLVLI